MAQSPFKYAAGFAISDFQGQTMIFVCQSTFYSKVYKL